MKQISGGQGSEPISCESVKINSEAMYVNRAHKLRNVKGNVDVNWWNSGYERLNSKNSDDDGDARTQDRWQRNETVTNEKDREDRINDMWGWRPVIAVNEMKSCAKQMREWLAITPHEMWGTLSACPVLEMERREWNARQRVKCNDM